MTLPETSARSSCSCPRCGRDLKRIPSGILTEGGRPEVLLVCRHDGYYSTATEPEELSVECPKCHKELWTRDLTESGLRQALRLHGYRVHPSLEVRELSLMCDAAAALVLGGRA